MPGRGGARKRPPEADSPDEEYVQKRAKNNEAVDRTRSKKRAEEKETADRVEALREENSSLERQVEGLNRELDFLKQMFVAYAGKNKQNPSSTGAGNFSAAASEGSVDDEAAAPRPAPPKRFPKSALVGRVAVPAANQRRAAAGTASSSSTFAGRTPLSPSMAPLRGPPLPARKTAISSTDATRGKAAVGNPSIGKIS